MASQTSSREEEPLLSIDIAAIHDEDERLLARIGYTQDLKRHFNRWSTLSYAVSVLGILGSVPALFGIPLMLGGPASAVWAWLIGSLMASVISASVAELVSAYPTAGGMYFVTKSVVPPQHAAIWSWIIGWSNLLGQTAGVASLAYTVSQMILATASMNSSFDPIIGTYAYSPTPIQIVLLSILVLISSGIICSLATKTLHRIILWFAPINVLGTVVICIVLLIFTPEKASASWVFTNFVDGSGWGTGFSFILSFLCVAFTMTDYDATTHMSEETHDAAIRGPQAIRHAITISGILGLLITTTFCFCITDLEAVLASPTGLPAAQIFLNAAGVKGGTVMWFFVILVQFFTACSAMLADTRMAYAFSRDGALPFSKFLASVNTRTETPLNSVWFIVAFSASLNLIGVGSTATMVGIFNITAPALDLSYAAVILARTIYESSMPFIPGPYKLGVWRKPLNYITMVWVTFISIVLMFPTTRPVTAENMNYAVVVAGVIAIGALTWWFAGAKNVYIGPRTKELLEDSLDESQEVYGNVHGSQYDQEFATTLSAT